MTKIDRKSDEKIEILKDLLNKIQSNPNIQGHICINNTEIFETSLYNNIYGFPSGNNIEDLPA